MHSSIRDRKYVFLFVASFKRGWYIQDRNSRSFFGINNTGKVPLDVAGSMTYEFICFLKFQLSEFASFGSGPIRCRAKRATILRQNNTTIDSIDASKFSALHVCRRSKHLLDAVVIFSDCLWKRYFFTLAWNC